MAFVRFGAMGFSFVLPILGAGTAVSDPSATHVVGLCLVAVCFHAFAFVLNDVIDLDLDRTEPRRAAFPLVRGVIGPASALWFALAQVPLSFVIALSLRAEVAPLVALGGAYVLMTVYNVLGKKTPVPWLTDAAQAMAWAALTLFGALSVSGDPSLLTYVTMAYVALYVQMVNGVHGGLRDLENDVRAGSRTTAICMGAHVTADGRSVPGKRMSIYAMTLQGILVGTALVPLAVGGSLSTPGMGRLALLAVVACGAAAFLLLSAGYRSLDARVEAKAVGLVHSVVTILPLFAITLPELDPWLSVTVVALFLLPIPTIHGQYPGLHWVLGIASGSGGVRRTLLAFPRIIRVQNCVAAGLAAVLGAYLNGATVSTDAGTLFLAAMIVMVVVALGNVANDLVDVEVDRVGKAGRPLPSGDIARPMAFALAAALGLSALGLIAFLPLPATVFAVSAMTLGVVYSLHLKSTVLIGNGVVAALSSSTLLFGGFLVGPPGSAVVAATCMVFPFVFGREVLKDVADHEGDRASGITTVSTRLGRRPSLLVFTLSMGLFCLTAILPPALGIGDVGYLVAIVLLGVAPTLRSVILVNRSPSAESIARTLRITKLAWFTGLGAMVLLR
jgi:geranylgeranylglycerol-phosphate geranylgeranyltransferase